MKRNGILLLLITALLILNAEGCSFSNEHESGKSEETTNMSDNRHDEIEEVNAPADKKGEPVFKINKLCSGDAKLADKDTVVTSIGSRLTFIKNGEIVKQYEDIHANWLDVIGEEGLVVYANWDKQVGILKVDKAFNIVSNDIIMEGYSDLGIDVAVCKADNVYYITVTYIKGTINNSDKNGKNGEYTISLYKSQNLKTWDKVSDIITMGRNLEDTDLNYFEGKLYLTYEKELCDKNNSSINLLISEDGGLTFGENKTLIEENGDNEPAGIIFKNDKYYLFYSSDIENKGGSYETADMYMQQYNRNFKTEKGPVKLKCAYGKGTLFYDMLWQGDELYCLFAGNYITQNNLVLERFE